MTVKTATYAYPGFSDALHAMTARTTRTERTDDAVIRARLDGRTIGHTRMRSVVDEGDRMKFYGLSFFLRDEDFQATRIFESRDGTVVGVETDTPYGTLRIDSPPGLRAPSGRRAAVQAERILRAA